MNTSMRMVSASWVIVGDPDVPPIRRGAVVFGHDGEIVAVGEQAPLAAKYEEVPTGHLAAVLMPGLCNAHVHLELSALRERVAGGRGFVPWLLDMRRVQTQVATDLHVIERAIQSMADSGTIAIGEVTNTGASVEALRAAPLHSRVFHEVYGLRFEQGDAMRRAAQERVQRLEHEYAHSSMTERQGVHRPSHRQSHSVTPHSLYGLHPDVIRALVREAKSAAAMLSIHFAEHPAERMWLESGGGPWSSYLKTVGISTEQSRRLSPRMGPSDYAMELGALHDGVLLVHATDAYPRELEQVARSGAHVVLCPRSNRFIEGHYPVAPMFLQFGIRPALGTDSLASNDSLDVMSEARVLMDAYPEVPLSTWVAMLTQWGADALGFGDILGTLAPGKRPGILAVRHGVNAPEDPLRFVLESNANDRAWCVPNALT
jgi:cytosine/adenosine deaminase-related metal-dependent hydrolase